ncbi:MAG: GntR family transcriptional regulator [Roseobacter sp.]
MIQPKASNTQRAVHEMRKRIFDGELGPGSDHLESELAHALDMSRTPVREAILVLAAQGLVSVRPRRGMRVLALSAKDMCDIYDVLTALESRAAERAAEQGYSADDLRGLRTAINDMDASLALEDRQKWALSDERFHRELMRLGQNARMEAIASMMVDQVRRARNVTLYMRPLPLKSNEDHRAVLEAIAAGDPKAAYARHYAHRTAARDMIVSLLELHHLPQV